MTKRGHCKHCLRRAVQRQGEGHDGRPRYVCLSCGESYTKGHQGEPWDTQPALTKRLLT